MTGSEGGNGSGARVRGVASRWNDKGFCFIKPENGGEEVFCHSSGIKDGNCIREGATVEFDSTMDERKGKLRAENVTGGYYEERRPMERSRGMGACVFFSPFLLLLF